MQSTLQEFELFFQPPNIFDQRPEVYSSLYLLRRDIYTCFGKDPCNKEKKLESIAYFPGTMAIMAGIDLLAKFVYLDDEFGKMKSGERFKEYVKKYIDSKYAETLYQLRNSLLHSFGLYSKTKHTQTKPSQEYRFILTRGSTNMVESTDGGFYIIDIGMLWSRFEDSVEKAKADMKKKKGWEEDFALMFERYGAIEIKLNQCRR